MSTPTIRRAGPGDAATIARHRVAMFRDMGYVPTDEVARRLFDASLTAIEKGLRDDTYVAWLAVTNEGEVVAGAGVHIKPHLPRVSPDGQGIEAGPLPLVVNVYTEP